MMHNPRHTPALPVKEVRALDRALSAGDVTVFVDGTALRLPAAARDAVLDLLVRLGRGEAVTVASAAAESAGSTGSTGSTGSAGSTGSNVPAGTGSGVGEVPLLTTSQAAAAAGISHTYLRNLTDAGVIPVEYRGTHRRIRLADVQAWLADQRAAKAAGTGPEPAGQ